MHCPWGDVISGGPMAPCPLTCTYTGHTYGKYRGNGAGWWGHWDLLPPHILLKVAVLSSEQGPSSSPKTGESQPASVSIPLLVPNSGAVPVAPGQYLMPWSHMQSLLGWPGWACRSLYVPGAPPAPHLAERRSSSSAPRRGSAEPRPRGCSGQGEPRPALPSF